jgi:CubicO group peptidase (beta-lactamase class C family)
VTHAPRKSTHLRIVTLRLGRHRPPWWSRRRVEPEAIVQPATLLPEMFTARVPIDASTSDLESYGYGWRITDPPDDLTYSHPGGINGFKSANLIKPRHELAVTVLSNDESIDAVPLAAMALR